MMPGISSAPGKPKVEFADQLDLQGLLGNLMYWQSNGPDKVDSLIQKFNSLTAYYAKSIKFQRSDVEEGEEDEEPKTPKEEASFAKHEITTAIKLKGNLMIKEIPVIYHYSEPGNKEFEDCVSVMFTESAAILDLLMASFEQLYKMRPMAEMEKEASTESYLPNPSRPDMVEEPEDAVFFGLIKKKNKRKANFALDDQLSPYRRGSNVVKQMQETSSLLARANAFHHYGMLDVELGMSVNYQIARKQMESTFIQNYVKPNILQYTNAGILLKIKLEQQLNADIISRSYEEKYRRREQPWQEQMRKQQTQ